MAVLLGSGGFGFFLFGFFGCFGFLGVGFFFFFDEWLVNLKSPFLKSVAYYSKQD